MHDIVIFSFESEAVSHGPIVIGSHLLDNGYTVKIVNFTATHFTYETLEKKVLELVVSDKQVVGFGLTFAVPSDKWAIDLIIKTCLRKFPKIHFIFGGYTNMAPYLRPSANMHFTIGQNDEDRIVEVLHSITKKPILKKYDFYSSKLRIDDLYKGEESYLESMVDKIGFIEINKVCKFSCDFCSHASDSRSPSIMREKAQIIEQLEHQHRTLKTNSFFILNQTFNESIDNFKYMLDVSKQLSFRPSYMVYTRMELTQYQKFPLYDEFYNNYVNATLAGVDSFNPVSLRSISKMHDVPRLKEIVINFKKRYPHISISAMFVTGLPGFKIGEDIQHAIDWAIETKAIDTIKLSNLILRPVDQILGNNATDFERNPEKYGYKFVNKKGEWQHEDGFTKSMVDAEYAVLDEFLETKGFNGITFVKSMRSFSSKVPYGTPNYLPDV